MSKKILTLNIGASAVVLAEYDLGGKAPTLVNYGTAALAAPLDSGNAGTVLVPALLEIVREKGMRPGKTVVSLSGQMVFPRFAAIPMAGGEEKFDQLVRYEIEQNVPFPIDEMVCDRQILGDTENGDKAVMIVAAKIEQVEAITSAMASAGFAPEMVDVAPVALTNVLRAARGDDGCSVILDIGAKTTSLVIVEGDKIYNRSIPVAGNALTKEISQLFGCPAEEAERIKREQAYVSMGGVTEDEDETREAIAKACRNVMTRIHAEISRSINFYRSQQGGGAPTKLFLAGGTSLLPQTDAFFADSLGIEVEYLNPFECVSAAPSVDQTALETDTVLLAATAGLALHAAGRASLAIDLLPPSIVEAREEAARVPFAAVGAIALVAALACWLVGAKDKTARIAEEVETTGAEASRLSAIASRVSASDKAEKEAYDAATNLAARISRRTVEVDRLNEVRRALSINPGIWISYWKDAVETVKIPDPKARGRNKEIEASVPVTYLHIRCWRDVYDSISGGAQPAAAPAGEGGQEGAGPAADAADAPEAAAGAPRYAATRTVGMIVADRLMKGGLVEKVVEDKSPSYGKGDSLKEIRFKIQFKEPQCK